MTQEEARNAAEGQPLAFRSCWNCNGSHDYLKEAEYVIRCFGCGHLFYKGVQLTEEQ